MDAISTVSAHVEIILLDTTALQGLTESQVTRYLCIDMMLEQRKKSFSYTMK